MRTIRFSKLPPEVQARYLARDLEVRKATDRARFKRLARERRARAQYAPKPPKRSEIDS
jgi:hypothetical protein